MADNQRADDRAAADHFLRAVILNRGFVEQVELATDAERGLIVQPNTHTEVEAPRVLRRIVQVNVVDC